jgi:hypothetical protein
MKIWILIFLSILYLAQACQNQPPKIINPDKQLLDSLIQDAKWELYKFNYHGERFLSSDSTMPKYHLPYKDTIRLMVNCELALWGLQKRGDTIYLHFNYYDDDQETLISNLGQADKERKYMVFPDYHGIDYINNRKAFIHPGGCLISTLCYEKSNAKDIDFQAFIDKNRAIITNHWLLRYHDSLKLKTK